MSVKTSVMNLAHYPPERLIRLARLQEELGYDVFWYTDERFYREVFGGLTLAAVNTRRIQLGTMVTDPYVRHPAVTAMGIATLDELSGGRAVLGVGAGLTGFSEMKIERRKPTQAMREMVTVIRQLMTGAVVDFDGRVIQLARGHLGFQPVRAQVPVYIASNGASGLALAGEIAEGVVMPSAVADSAIDLMLEYVGTGAARAGRRLSDLDLVARVNVCIDADPTSAKDLMRPELARSLIAQQPEFPSFRWARLRVSERMREAVASLDWACDPQVLSPIAEMIPDEFVDALALAGTAEQVAAGVIRMVRRGVTHILINPLARNGEVENVITRFALEVMPMVRRSAFAESG